ncbi:MAG: SPFH domain-containing protein [Defluviicoccus sp.]|nr:SPFH domain-containing protein [Defluviicoccus sp.]MDE0384989.1 SPFH domain-containing protein [Defluviicoccus sp.]
MPDAPEATAPSTRVIHAVFDYMRDRKTVLLAALAAVAVLALLADGVFVVKKEEQAVLTRFGKVVDPKILPGIHYALPLVERAHVRKVTRITRRGVGTRDETGKVAFSILSGDANLFEADVALQYRIGSLKSYLYATVDPDAVLTLIVRERLIEIMGKHFIDLIFTTNRDIIQSLLFKDTSAYLKDHDIGIELLALNIVDVRPIEETVAAFRDVSDAIAEGIQAVSNANRRMEKLLARSRGQAQAVVMNAKARARERRLQAGSSAKIFADLLVAYRSQPSSVTVTRYWQRMRTIFREATLSTVNPGDASAIDINMVEGFVPGLGRAPVAAVAAAPGRRNLAGARRSLSTVSETSGHGFENVGSDRFLMDGRFHAARGERHHLSTAKLRSLIFDDLSIFSHRHVAPTSVAAAAERKEKPLVNRTTVIPDEEDESRPAQAGHAKPARQKSEKAPRAQSAGTARAKPEKPAKAGGAERKPGTPANAGKTDGPAG